jgi:hypothetical protein
MMMNLKHNGCLENVKGDVVTPCKIETMIFMGENTQLNNEDVTKKYNIQLFVISSRTHPFNRA